MAYKVTRTKETGHENRGSGYDEYSVVWDYELITVKADTYANLITGIDEIPDADLTWSGAGSLGIEGMPNKVKGKWVAQLKTPRENERKPPRE